MDARTPRTDDLSRPDASDRGPVGTPDPVLDPTWRVTGGAQTPMPGAEHEQPPSPAEPAADADDDRDAPNESADPPDPERTGRYRTSDTATGEPGT